jgi:hypothetical protein
MKSMINNMFKMKIILIQTIIFISLLSQTLFGSDLPRLSDYVNAKNIKGYFYANSLSLPATTNSYLPISGYRSFFLVLTNIKPPLTINGEQLRKMNLIDSKNRQFPYAGVSFGPDKNGSFGVLNATETQVICKNSSSVLDISLLFMVQEDCGELTLSYNGEEISLKQVVTCTPSSNFEFSDCNGTMVEGTSFSTWLPHTYKSGTGVILTKDITPSSYSVEVKDIDTTSSPNFFIGIKVLIKKNINQEIGVLVLDSSSIAIRYVNQKKLVLSKGFLTNRRERIVSSMPETEKDFKVITLIGRSGSELSSEGGTFGANQYYGVIDNGKAHPFTSKGISPHFQGNTIEIEFIFEKQKSFRPSALVLGKYIVSLSK